MRVLVAVALFCTLLGCSAEVSPEPTGAPAPATSQELRPPVFREVAEARGLSFRFRDDASEVKRMYETMGGGVVVFDFDGDGHQDLFLPGGGSGAGSPEGTTHQALFRNDGTGRFADVTVSAGLEPEGDYATGGAADDFDGDGDLDLYVTCLGRNRYYTNNGGKFVEVAEAAGAAGGDWSTVALPFDADGDGDPDLLVVNYVEYDREDELPCTLDGRRVYCTPEHYPDAENRFYRNDGGRFIDATVEAGLVGLGGKGLAGAAADLDDDGDVDVYVANDVTPNQLLVNDGTGRFVDDALLMGAALGRNGRAEASMGVAVLDVDGDLDADLTVTNFSREVFDLFRLEDGFYTEVSDLFGIAHTTRTLLGFGVVATDVDFDGELDLVYGCGHINDLADELEVGVTFRQPNLLLRSSDGSFSSWPEAEGDLARPDVVRGLAVADLDGDGDGDLVAQRLRDGAALFENTGRPGSGWVAVAPVNGRGVPVWGATVTLEMSDGSRRRQWLAAGGSYASQSEPVVRFGVGSGNPPVRVEVRFPGGGEEVVPVEALGRIYRVVRP